MCPEEETQFDQSNLCWLCGEPFSQNIDAEGASDTEIASRKVRDNDHLTGKYKGGAIINAIWSLKQKSSRSFPIFFHNVSGQDCHLLFGS